MAIDKAKDDKFFNQTQNDGYDEKDYITNQYADKYHDKIYDFLTDNNEIKNFSTHQEIYDLIEDKLGYKRKEV